ncbi:MAG: 2Fe-2S iron-sulfur cluster binding domain-containing protein [Saprospiraceae bacterium]|nr:2Fe-2S iron-sulfur cluster binding domain-containing protein [Saprospiraceae bacterium]
MINITFITQAGESKTVQASSGTIMELARQHGIEGIDGDCGGVCSCATCHVHVDPAFAEVVGEPSDIEKDMLELDDHADAYSRLGCQIEIEPSFDGLILTVAN